MCHPIFRTESQHAPNTALRKYQPKMYEAMRSVLPTSFSSSPAAGASAAAAFATTVGALGARIRVAHPPTTGEASAVLSRTPPKEAAERGFVAIEGATPARHRAGEDRAFDELVRGATRRAETTPMAAMTSSESCGELRRARRSRGAIGPLEANGIKKSASEDLFRYFDRRIGRGHRDRSVKPERRIGDPRTRLRAAFLVVFSRLSLAVQIQIMARGASSGTAKRDPTPKQHGDDDDVESRWSAKRAALAAERRERRLATLETRLLELSEGAEKADDRAGRRLRALLVDLKLAEAEDNEHGAPEHTNDVRATASSDIEPTRKAKPSPFGGIVRGSDVYATSSSEDEASDSDEGLGSFDRGAKSLMHSATLSAARAEAVHAALGRTRAELEEDRVDRQVAARAVADAMAATREAASAEADARRLRQALDVARREHVEASSRASRAEAEASTLRFALRGGGGRNSEEDAEEARRASEQAREECARAYARAAAAEQELVSATSGARRAERERDALERAKDATEDRRARAEAAAATAQAEARRLRADLESVARRFESRESKTKALEKRCAAQDAELAELRALLRAQREDIATAMRLVGEGNARQ